MACEKEKEDCRVKFRVIGQRGLQANSAKEAQPLDVWHERFEHANYYRTLRAAIRHAIVTGFLPPGDARLSQEERFCEARLTLYP